MDLIVKRQLAILRIRERMNPKPKVWVMSEHHKVLLDIVNDAGQIRSEKLYSEYQGQMMAKGRFPCPRNYRNYMNRLVAEGLVKASGEYRWREYAKME